MFDAINTEEWDFPIEVHPTPNAITGEPLTNSKQIVRTDSNEVLGVHKSAYKPVLHSDVVNSIEDAVLESDVSKDFYIDTKVYENGAKLKGTVHFRDLYIENKKSAQVGDIVNFKVDFLNSYDGSWSFLQKAEGNRLICENGMKVNDARLNSRHLTSSQATQDGVYEILSDEAKELDSKALISKVRDVVASTSDEVRFGEQVQAMTDASNIKIKKPKKVIEILENKFSLTKDEGDNILENLMHNDTGNKEPNVWATVNSITKLGNTMDDYDRGTEMQKFGGMLLTMPELISA